MTKRKKDDEPELTVKQKKFVDRYIATGNKKQSAIDAGYSAKYADRQANQTLKLDYVQEYLQAQMDKLHAKNIANAYDVLEVWSSILWGKRKEPVVLPNSEVQWLEPNNSEVIAAGKEIMKRWPDDMVKAKIRKLKADTELTEAKTQMLGSGDKNAEDQLGSLIDKMDAIARDDKDDDDK